MEMWGPLRVEGPGALVCASLLHLVSLTGTQGRECHKVGGGASLLACCCAGPLVRERVAGAGPGQLSPFSRTEKGWVGRRVCETEVGTAVGIGVSPRW